MEPARDDPALLERLHPGGPDIAAQANFAVTDEWATTVEDVVRRRTTVALRGLAGPASVDASRRGSRRRPGLTAQAGRSETASTALTMPS